MAKITVSMTCSKFPVIIWDSTSGVLIVRYEDDESVGLSGSIMTRPRVLKPEDLQQEQQPGAPAETKSPISDIIPQSNILPVQMQAEPAEVTAPVDYGKQMGGASMSNQNTAE